MHKKFLFGSLWSCQLPGNNLYRMEAALPEPDEALMYFPYLYVHGKLFFLSLIKLNFPFNIKETIRTIKWIYKGINYGIYRKSLLIYMKNSGLSYRYR